MTTDPRALLDAYAVGHEAGAIGCRGFNRRDHAPAAIAALRGVLDYCDDLDKIDLYAGPAFCLRTIIRIALEAS